MTDHRRLAPHVSRNAAPIAEVACRVLPKRGRVLDAPFGAAARACTKPCSVMKARRWFDEMPSARKPVLVYKEADQAEAAE